MSIEAAYSKELKEVISALEANEFYRQGKLRNARAFSCVGSDDCKAQLTCANFTKLPNEWIVSPYFKQSTDLSPHSSNCNYVKLKVTANNKINKLDGSLKKTGDFNLIIDSKGFIKPKADNPSIEGKSKKSSIMSYTKKSKSSKNKTRNENSDIKSLRKLVDIYQSLDYNNSTTMVNIDSSSLTLKELFFNLDSKKEFKIHTQIYFGKATIYERKKKMYFI